MRNEGEEDEEEVEEEQRQELVLAAGCVHAKMPESENDQEGAQFFDFS